MTTSTQGFLIEYPADLGPGSLSEAEKQAIAKDMTYWAGAITGAMETHDDIEARTEALEQAAAALTMIDPPLYEAGYQDLLENGAPEEALKVSGLSADRAENLEILERHLSAFEHQLEAPDVYARFIPEIDNCPARWVLFAGAIATSGEPDGIGYLSVRQIFYAGLFPTFNII